MSAYTDRLARGWREHGDAFDASDLHPRFGQFYGTGARIRVRTVWGAGTPDEFTDERTGTVGTTTGFRPSFLLMRRSSDHGSSDLLGERDEIVAVKHPGARAYRPIHSSEVVA